MFDVNCSTKTVAAVERKLQIITEAAIRLGSDAEHRAPGPLWQNIRGFGNWLRHQYERVELRVIWKTVIDDLPTLKTSVLRALSPEPPESSFWHTIHLTQNGPTSGFAGWQAQAGALPPCAPLLSG